MENHEAGLREDIARLVGELNYGSAHNVLPFSKGSSPPATDEAATAFDLINETAVMIGNLEARALAAEQAMRDATARAGRAEQRAAAAEAELCAMLRRMSAAEAQTEDAKQALTRVEEAIRAKLLNLRRIAFNEPNLVA